MQKHRKHTKLTKREFGNYAPNEISILGTKCDVINNLVNMVSNKLSSKYKLAYLDASHQNDIQSKNHDIFTVHASGKLESNVQYELNRYNDKIKFSIYDVLFINGNHFQSEQQVLILDSEKEKSILKRLDQLSNIQFIIKLNADSKFFDFLLEKYPDIKNLNCYSLDEIDKISNHFERLIQQKIAPVKGMVLAGGKSLRMGTDKGLMDYYGKSQRNHMFELLEQLNLETFLSVRKEQKVENISIVEDTFIGLGPFGAICSAFQQNPNSAWLVIATDLPFVDENLIKLLLEKRNPSKIATAIKGKQKDFPEPLITIWEPKSYPILLNYIALGISCPRKVLINSDVEIIEVDENLIVNVNTKEEFEAVKKTIENQNK